jgi:hypothetical protein
MRRPAGRCAMRTPAIGRMGSGSIHPCGCAIVVERSDVEIPIARIVAASLFGFQKLNSFVFRSAAFSPTIGLSRANERDGWRATLG